MEIAVVTMWYNEAFLAPFFLSHYGYADKIHILLDIDTNDKTREICERYGNVEIEDMTFPDGIDDGLKVRKIETVVAAQTADWVFAVDADELIFPANNESASVVLARQTANVLYAQMWQVYRHVTDADLDPGQPAIYQRRHGDPDLATPFAHAYLKPIIVKPEAEIAWSVGCHFIQENKNIKVSREKFQGVHWQMADSNMAVERRMERRRRLSKENLRRGWGHLHFNITEEEIRADCKAHENDPLVF